MIDYQDNFSLREHVSMCISDERWLALRVTDWCVEFRAPTNLKSIYLKSQEYRVQMFIAFFREYVVNP